MKDFIKQAAHVKPDANQLRLITKNSVLCIRAFRSEHLHGHRMGARH